MGYGNRPDWPFEHAKPLPQPGYQQASVGPSPAPKPLRETSKLREARQRLLSTMSKRMSTDSKMSAAWVVSPLLVVIILAGAAIIYMTDQMVDIGYEPGEDLYSYSEELNEVIANALLFVVAGGLFHLSAFALLIFFLVDRRNKHVHRERDLRETLMGYVSSVAADTGYGGAVEPELRVMEHSDMESIRTENDMSPELLSLTFMFLGAIGMPVSVLPLYTDITEWGLGSVLALAGVSLLITLGQIIVTLYILSRLGEQNYNHAVNWNNFSYGALYGLYKVGTPVMEPYRPPNVKERSFALYLILSIFTGGLFVYYWWYTLIKDPNDHYKTQWHLEDLIARAIAR